MEAAAAAAAGGDLEGALGMYTDCHEASGAPEPMVREQRKRPSSPHAPSTTTFCAPSPRTHMHMHMHMPHDMSHAH
eukprot:3938472-Prymnesium_polylepis.1